MIASPSKFRHGPMTISGLALDTALIAVGLLLLAPGGQVVPAFLLSFAAVASGRLSSSYMLPLISGAAVGIYFWISVVIASPRRTNLDVAFLFLLPHALIFALLFAAVRSIQRRCEQILHRRNLKAREQRDA